MFQGCLVDVEHCLQCDLKMIILGSNSILFLLVEPMISSALWASDRLAMSN